MTNAVNELVAARCSHDADSWPVFLWCGPIFGQGNNGEIFYSMVADPTQKLNELRALRRPGEQPLRCVHPRVPAHDQLRQHYLKRAGAPEVLWLTRGSPTSRRRWRPQLPAGRLGTFCNFVGGDPPQRGPVLQRAAGPTTCLPPRGRDLAERGAMWLFVRYLVDQYAADQSLTAGDVVTRQLEQTSLTGAATGHVTGRPFAETVAHWRRELRVRHRAARVHPSPGAAVQGAQVPHDYPTLSARCPAPNGIQPVFRLVPPSARGAW